MITDGISIKGQYHNINQDYFISKEFKDGYIMVVSDGMGSKKMSQIGSKVICESIYDRISQGKIDLNLLEFKDVLFSCHKEWKKRLEEFDLSQCYCTLLVVIVLRDKIKAARLGDGFLSIYVDDNIYCLFDDKEEHFLNETDCLREKFDREKIEILDLDYKTFKGAICCSDGIEIGTMQKNEICDFTKDFIISYSNKNKTDILDNIKIWLNNWTGNDDKTIAYIMEGEM